MAIRTTMRLRDDDLFVASVASLDVPIQVAK